jgi:hypothetical protein
MHNNLFIKKSFILIATVVALSSCSTKPSERIKNKTWEGQIYRSEDNKQLSDVRLKFSNDSLYIFANAIFGADNDTLTLVKHEEKDSTFVFRNIEGETFKFFYQYKKEEKTENFYLTGNDYYVVLGNSELDLSDPTALNFYENISVPRKAFMYLDGAYEGEIEFENQMMNLFSMFSLGPIKIKFVFLDGFKVKSFGSSFWGSESEIHNYVVKGDKLYILSNSKKKKKSDGGKFETEGFKVVDNGYKLVLQTDDANVILRKSY